jgi:hypothetical protein
MRKFLVPAGLACVVWFAAAQSEDDSLYWYNNYRDAVREARRTGKPIFLEYRCEP